MARSETPACTECGDRTDPETRRCTNADCPASPTFRYREARALVVLAAARGHAAAVGLDQHPETTVYRTSRSHVSHGECYHADPDCHRFACANRIIPTPLGVARQYLSPCPFCVLGERVGGGGGNGHFEAALAYDPDDGGDERG